jgi:Tfp pilus assembly protein PilV
MIDRNARKPRRGMTVVAVLVCLLVLMILGAALLRIALVERESNRAAERRLQADWLVESGLERASARLAADPRYPGENWQVSAADLGLAEPGESGAAAGATRAAGVVSILVDRAAKDTGRLRVRVQADYPRDGPFRTRRSQERFIDLEPKKNGASP